MEQVQLGQLIRDHKELYYFNLLKNFELDFILLTTYLLAFISTLALAFLINELTYRIQFGGKRTIKFTERFTSTVSSFKLRRLSAIGMLALFVYLSLWLTQVFFTNNIKTNKVVSPGLESRLLIQK